MEFPKLPEGWAWEVVREDYKAKMTDWSETLAEVVPTVRIKLLDEARVAVRNHLMIEHKYFDTFSDLRAEGFVPDAVVEYGLWPRSRPRGVRSSARSEKDLVREANRLWSAQQEEDKALRDLHARTEVLDRWVGTYPPKKLGEV